MPVLLAALAPRMLRLAGAVADGTILWMTGPETVAGHIVPKLTAAADEAGRPAPRIVCTLPICVTDDPAAGAERANEAFSIYGQLPSYRAMLDLEGAAGPGDVAIVGDEESVRRQVAGLAEAGVTDFVAASFGQGEEAERTRALLRGLVIAPTAEQARSGPPAQGSAGEEAVDGRGLAGQVVAQARDHGVLDQPTHQRRLDGQAAGDRAGRAVAAAAGLDRRPARGPEAVAVVVGHQAELDPAPRRGRGWSARPT